ncbi:transglutaminase-like domain-containing protein [Evansella cellulosilytica]|uniref:Transglutaminase domain-containing protein n=1 Tax=Evansella cellulosilytica (strain ATCC 21833 / DSM 2522 / FERM P-1141 / JCM 9156 / N-4) TaxID=649639 RepID=E6U0Q0_EVAC2|nr:transglutaminase-like domain-containing protein [Evansella cellulosilytica]ADU29098.1 transglutaminase domain-containing protein [Evansella cellulosilytica DSM 2522]
MKKYLMATNMLDFECNELQQLIESRKWKDNDEFHKILNIYNFVRDEIKFGYNVDDSIPASKVLDDGYGQCNTKGTLFMALLRSVGIPCRIHGFTIDKKLQKGAMTGLIYKLAPNNIVHSWVEIYFEGKWLNIEGFILDMVYLNKLQLKFSECYEYFCGYGVATNDFKKPQIEWNMNDTYIQKEGINQDFGIFHSPDEFLEQHSQELSTLKKWFYQNIGRKLMNRNVSKIREG